MGRAEALVHAARLYLLRMDSSRAFVKLDFKNAFNSIRRDTVLQATHMELPPSSGRNMAIMWLLLRVSSRATHWALLCSLALNKLLRDTGAEFVSGYLDDIRLGDTVPRLVEQFRRLECAANKIGHQLNHDKCQILGLFAVSGPTWVKSGFNFVVRSSTGEEASLLGSPIHSHGIEPALAHTQSSWREICHAWV